MLGSETPHNTVIIAMQNYYYLLLKNDSAVELIVLDLFTDSKEKSKQQFVLSVMAQGCSQLGCNY